MSGVLLSECDMPPTKAAVNYEMPVDANVHVITPATPRIIECNALPPDAAHAEGELDWKVSGGSVVLVNSSSTDDYTFAVTLPPDSQCADAEGTVFLTTWFTTDEDNTMEDIFTFVIHVPKATRLVPFNIATKYKKKEALRRAGGCWAGIPNEPHAEVYPTTPVKLLGLPIAPTEEEETWRCGQGFEGGLTHYGNYNAHSIDFQCEEGTPVLAADGGVVRVVIDKHDRSGGHVAHLFEGYNEVVVVHSDGTEACYLHLEKGSALVSAGDSVMRGQQLACTGSVGFAPWPHIHFQLNRSSTTKDRPDELGPSVPFAFDSPSAKAPFVPVAGYTYGVSGRVDS